MNTLTQFEKNFINHPTAKKGLKIASITKKKDQISTANNQAFTRSCELADLVADSVQWIHSANGVNTLKKYGLEWTNLDLAIKVFGLKKAWFYKLQKVGKMDAKVINGFVTACERLGVEGVDVSPTIAELIKFEKYVADADIISDEMVEVAIDGYIADILTTDEDEDAFEGEVELATEEVEEVEEVEETEPNTQFQMTWVNADGKNVSVRVDNTGNLITSNTQEEIGNALSFFTNIRVQSGLLTK